VREIVETESHLVISALAGDAAAGGVPFALAADYVLAREDVVLNPYYSHMGGLYGSEYWTYLMPRRIGHELTDELTSAPFEPIGTRRAVEIGLLDDAFGEDVPRFRGQVRALARDLAAASYLPTLLEAKRRARRLDEQIKPLSAYRAEELARSYQCFFGDDRSYHEARHRFVHKLGAPCQVTPALRWAA
jgi:putative two-component system protein, hydrogenase maturation factor HypX/HoxX